MSRPIDILFPDFQSKIDSGICTTCGLPAKEFKDKLSAKEHKISGLCQKCQDSVFG
jgi:hypothetical protein